MKKLLFFLMGIHSFYIGISQGMSLSNIDVVRGSFKQGHANNCASVAIIKLGIIVYGINNMFSVNSLPNSYLIKFRNNDSIEVSKNDFAQLENSSRFVLLDSSGVSRDIYKYARQCFAIEVAYYSRQYSLSYEQAVRKLLRGVNTDSVYKYVGLPDNSIQFLSSENKGSENPGFYSENVLYLLYNDAHATIASGKKYDEYGEWEDNNKFYSNHHKRQNDKVFYAYIIK